MALHHLVANEVGWTPAHRIPNGHNRPAVSRYSRRVLDAMVERGWLLRHPTLGYRAGPDGLRAYWTARGRPPSPTTDDTPDPPPASP